MQQPPQQQQRMERFYRQELEELANTRTALRAKYRPGSQSESDDDSLNERDFGVDGYDSGPEVEAADMQTHIPESNMGYRLLVKMGWKAGTGLGQNATGRKAPIEIERKQDVLGIGKQAVDIWYAEASTAKRKTLEAERQAEETVEEKAKRELQVRQQQAVSAELEMVKSAFYCALCDKQYERISDYGVHLSSYDHNHKKRFKDMKDTSRAGSASTTNKIKEKERRREEKELAKIQQAALKRAGGKATSGEPIQNPPAMPPLETGGFQPVQQSGFQPVQQSGFQPVQQSGFQPVQQSGFQPVQQSSFQPVQQSGFQPVQQSGIQPVQQSGFQPVQQSGFQPVQLGSNATRNAPLPVTTPDEAVKAGLAASQGTSSGFQSVKLGGFQSVKSTSGFRPVKPVGFQSAADDEDIEVDSAPAATTSDPSQNNAVGASPSGFQPVKLGGFKPMKFGAFQLKKPGSK
ncbi:G patch domain-containing protein 8 [Mortierella alpina]|uniref:G patch domain-containing protein 8 n=1 Tax=Mortierella alpina TaxID=64518 RepID=A0A9P6M046_MORAP|nr:G patch domain-containing protein 8 [Mortierella alpina]